MERNRDLQGRLTEYWVRRALLLALLGFVVAGLANVFGQRPEPAQTDAGRARLELLAPETVRGGLLYEARFTIHARQELKDARVVLAEGWTEGMTINTIEPSPLGEASDDGRLSLDLGHVPAGEKYVLYLQFQVNPTNVGRRSQDVDLYDGDVHVLAQRRSITVLP